MPKYKLIVRDANWQDRQFISLTKTTDDGRSFILHWIGANLGMKQPKTYLMSFANYAPNVAAKELEFKEEHTIHPVSWFGEPHASEAAYENLLDDDILEKLLRDKIFVDLVETSENHNNTFKEAAKKLLGTDITPPGHIRDFRNEMIKLYFTYLMSASDFSVNAHPDGLYTVIQAPRTDSIFKPYPDCFAPDASARITHAGVNNLNIDPDAISILQKKITALVTISWSSYSIQFNFMDQLLPFVNIGKRLQIDDPSPDQLKIIDHLFDFAEQHNLFPSDPKEMIKKAWKANCEKLAKANTTSYWKPGSSALLSSPVKSLKTDEAEKERLDIRFAVTL